MQAKEIMIEFLMRDRMIPMPLQTKYVPCNHVDGDVVKVLTVELKQVAMGRVIIGAIGECPVCRKIYYWEQLDEN